MLVEHWTSDEDLADGTKAMPDAIDTAGEGRGLFVYPVGAGVEWERRTRTWWRIPESCVREVQRFAPGSLDGENPPRLVIELFVDAANFGDLKREA